MSDQSAYLREIGNQVVVEMAERLEADLSERDSAAVVTAVLKAVRGGFLRGIATCVGGVNEQMAEKGVEWEGVDLQAWLDVPEVDEWAERYGGEA